jgi:transposase-like protein
MPQNYHVVSRNDSTKTLRSRPLAQALAKDGQLILPLLELLNTAETAIDDLIDVMGRATIEAVLLMSAAEVAGPRQQGKKTDRDVVYHGSQQGRVKLKDRQLQVEKPRLRQRKSAEGQPGEVEIPAYAAINAGGERLAARMLEILIGGVSTRRYANVITEMADTVGVSKSQVSRTTIEAGAEVLKALAEKTFHAVELLAVWIDGIQLGQWHVVCAVGVDPDGNKHVLGIREGATENTEVVKSLLQDLVTRGLDPKQRRLFILDGAKALRAGVKAVFGDDAKVQRCRNHKMRNVTGHLPKDQEAQARSTLRAAFKLGGKQGRKKLEQYAGWLEKDWPSAAASLREGLDELFTIDELDLPPQLKRCLGTTNIIDNSHSAARQRMARVKNWQSGEMAVRWLAVAFEASSKGFRRVMGYKSLWILKANLKANSDQEVIESEVKVG